MNPNIYDFKDPVKYLESVYKYWSKTEANPSVRKWTEKIAFDSAKMMMDLLKGKKKFTLSIGNTLAQRLGLDTGERAYFEALIKYSQAHSLEEKKVFELVLSELTKLHGTKAMVEDMNIFSHWVHMAIMTLTKVKGVAVKKENVRDYILEDVPQDIIDASVDRLIRAGLIQYNAAGALIRNYDHTTTQNDAYKHAPHPYFEQVSELAKKGSNLPADVREFQCFSIAIGHEDIELYKEMIRNFRGKLGSFSSAKEATQVYQCNIQFFPLTKAISDNLMDEKRAPHFSHSQT